MPNSTDYSNRPDTHTNNGGEQQKVDIETQQFVSDGNGKPEPEKPSLKLNERAQGIDAIRAKLAKIKTAKGLAMTLRRIEDFGTWLPEMITDDFMQSAKANGFSYRGRGASYGTCSFFVNEISKQQFLGFRRLSKQAFDEMWNEQGWRHQGNSWMGHSNNPFDSMPQGKMLMAFRGLMDNSQYPISKILNGYFGTEKMDNILLPGNEGDVIYTSVRQGTAESYAGTPLNHPTKRRYVMRMLISPEAKIMTDVERNKALKYLQLHQSTFLDAAKQHIAANAEKNGYTEQDIDNLANLVYNSLTHTESAIPVALGYDVYLREHCCVLNGRYVYSERDTYDEVGY